MHLIFQQREKFRPRSCVVFESAEQTGGLHDRVLFFDAAHHHAKMFRFYDDRHAGGLQTTHKRLRDLRSEVFLNLQSTRENIDNSRHLREADDFSVWNVSHVCAPDKWQQMMLT